MLRGSSFPRRRESREINTPRSGQNLNVDPLRGSFSINWIPACAGMTVQMGYLGSMDRKLYKQ